MLANGRNGLLSVLGGLDTRELTLGDAQHLLVDPELEGKFPVAPFCTGHLQRLMSFIVKGVCDDAGIEILVDDDGIAHIDLERSREWEAESEACC